MQISVHSVIREIEILLGRSFSQAKWQDILALVNNGILANPFDDNEISELKSLHGNAVETTVANPAIAAPKMQIEKDKPLESHDYKKAAHNLQRLLKVRGYSSATFRSYIRDMRGFARWLYARGARLDANVSEDLVVEFMIDRRSAGANNQILRGFRAALRLFCEANGRIRDFQLIRNTKGRKSLPVVLSAEEIGRILSHIRNPKHWLMVSLMYSSGLRVSEVVKLRVADIDIAQSSLTVRMGKGGKDRITILSAKQFDLLKNFMQNKYGPDFIFPSSTNLRAHISARSLQKIVERAIKAAGIVNGASAHSLRHSFATHLLEGGTDIRHIQKLLGHEHIRTTTIYTRVAKKSLQQIHSPL